MSAGITRTDRTVLDSQGAFVAGNTRRTVRRKLATCLGLGRRDSGPRATRSLTAISSPGGAFQPRPDRVLRAVAADGNVGGGRFASSELSERFAAYRGSSRVRNPKVTFTGGWKVAAGGSRPFCRPLAFGPPGGAGSRSAGDPTRDDVGGVCVAEARAGSVARRPPYKAAGRWQPAGRSASPDGGLRTARRRGRTARR